MPGRVDEFRVTALKALGANMWRGSYPGSSELMRHADAHGMLMWVENRLLRYKVEPISATSASRGRRVGDPQCQPRPGSN